MAKYKIPERYGTLYTLDGRTLKGGDVAELSPREAKAYALEPVKEEKPKAAEPRTADK